MWRSVVRVTFQALFHTISSMRAQSQLGSELCEPNCSRLNFCTGQLREFSLHANHAEQEKLNGE